MPKSLQEMSLEELAAEVGKADAKERGFDRAFMNCLVLQLARIGDMLEKQVEIAQKTLDRIHFMLG